MGGEGDIVTGGGGSTDILSIGTPVFASDRVAGELLAPDERRCGEGRGVPRR